ncbi:unnamed protein product [Gordionus sp. m RMFG-2023]
MTYNGHYDEKLGILLFACPECQLTSQAKCLKYFPVNPDYVVKPMNFNNIESNIHLRNYSSPQEMISDVKYIYHNTWIYHEIKHSRNSLETQKKLSTLKRVEIICKEEVNEIEACDECYHNAHTLPFDEWFTVVCGSVHTLVWAKMKGYPFWPGKVLRIHQSGGAIDIKNSNNDEQNGVSSGSSTPYRSWLPLQACFILSRSPPTGPMNTGIPLRFRNEYDEALIELSKYIVNLEKKFKIDFPYAETNIPFPLTTNISHNNASNYDINETLRYLYYQFKKCHNYEHKSSGSHSSKNPNKGKKHSKESFRDKFKPKRYRDDYKSYFSSNSSLEARVSAENRKKFYSSTQRYVKSKVYKVDTRDCLTCDSASDHSKVENHHTSHGNVDKPQNTHIVSNSDVPNSNNKNQHTYKNDDPQITLNTGDSKNNKIICQNENNYKDAGEKNENPGVNDILWGSSIDKLCNQNLSSILDKILQNIKSGKTSFPKSNIDTIKSNDTINADPNDDYCENMLKADVVNIELGKKLVIKLNQLQMSLHKDYSSLNGTAEEKIDNVFNSDSILLENTLNPEIFQSNDDVDTYAYHLIEGIDLNPNEQEIVDGNGDKRSFLQHNLSSEKEVMEDISDDDFDTTIIRGSKSLEKNNLSIMNPMNEYSFIIKILSKDDILKALEQKGEMIRKDIQDCCTHEKYLFWGSEQLPNIINVKDANYRQNNNYDKSQDIENEIFSGFQENPSNITNMKSPKRQGNDNCDKSENTKEDFPRSQELQSGNEIIKVPESRGNDDCTKFDEGTNETIDKSNHEIQISLDFQSNISSTLSIPDVITRTNKDKSNELPLEIYDKKPNLLEMDLARRIRCDIEEGEIVSEVIDIVELDLCPNSIEVNIAQVLNANSLTIENSIQISNNMLSSPMSNDIFVYNSETATLPHMTTISNIISITSLNLAEEQRVEQGINEVLSQKSLETANSNVFKDQLLNNDGNQEVTANVTILVDSNEMVSRDNEDIINTSSFKSCGLSEQTYNEESNCNQFSDIDNNLSSCEDYVMPIPLDYANNAMHSVIDGSSNISARLTANEQYIVNGGMVSGVERSIIVIENETSNISHNDPDANNNLESHKFIQNNTLIKKFKKEASVENISDKGLANTITLESCLTSIFVDKNSENINKKILILNKRKSENDGLEPSNQFVTTKSSIPSSIVNLYNNLNSFDKNPISSLLDNPRNTKNISKVSNDLFISDLMNKDSMINDDADIQILDAILGGLDNLQKKRRKIAKNEILNENHANMFNEEGMIIEEIEGSVNGGIDSSDRILDKSFIESKLKNIIDHQNNLQNNSEMNLTISNSLNLEPLMKNIELTIKDYIKKKSHISFTPTIITLSDNDIGIENPIFTTANNTNDCEIIPTVSTMNTRYDLTSTCETIPTVSTMNTRYDLTSTCEIIPTVSNVNTRYDLPSTLSENVDILHEPHNNINVLNKQAFEKILFDVHSHYKSQLDIADYRYNQLRLQYQCEFDQLNKEYTEQINENKKKQWCVNCFKEANSYCCIGIWYCSIACQQLHWQFHRENCVEYKNKVAVPIYPRNILNMCNSGAQSYNNTAMRNTIMNNNFNNPLPYLHVSQNYTPQLYNSSSSYYNNIPSSNSYLTNSRSIIHYPPNIQANQNMSSRILYPTCIHNTNILNSNMPFISTISTFQLRRYLENTNMGHNFKNAYEDLNKRR